MTPEPRTERLFGTYEDEPITHTQFEVMFNDRGFYRVGQIHSGPDPYGFYQVRTLVGLFTVRKDRLEWLHGVDKTRGAQGGQAAS